MVLGKKAQGAEGFRYAWLVLAEVAAGVLVILFVYTIMGKILSDSAEDVLARNIAMTVDTLSGAPGNVQYRYEDNTEDFDIIVDGNSVKVVSDTGSGKAFFLGMKGVSVEPNSLKSVLSIPVRIDANTVYFDEPSTQEQSQYCRNLEQNRDIRTVEISRERYPGQQNDANAELVKTYIDQYLIESKGIKKAATQADMKINILFGNENRVTITYDENTAGLQRLACFIQNSVREKHEADFVSVDISKGAEAKTIAISLGTGGLTQGKYEEYAKTIYAALTEGAKE